VKFSSSDVTSSASLNEAYSRPSISTHQIAIEQTSSVLSTTRELLSQAIRIESLSGILSARSDDDEIGSASVTWFVNFCGTPKIELAKRQVCQLHVRDVQAELARSVR
jgi:hypothetical protein